MDPAGILGHAVAIKINRGVTGVLRLGATDGQRAVPEHAVELRAPLRIAVVTVRKEVRFGQVGTRPVYQWRIVGHVQYQGIGGTER